jgi:hypothetical protein
MDISEQLSAALNHSDEPTASPTEYLRDTWLATSALQKAIRRGDLGTALQASSFLAEVQPDRLWRRLVVIALEDIGIADLNLVTMVLWASGKRAWRRDHGGEEKVASYVVSQLCAASKCRDGSDVLVIADHHPSLREVRAQFAGLTSRLLRGLRPTLDTSVFGLLPHPPPGTLWCRLGLGPGWEEPPLRLGQPPGLNS